MASAPTNSNHSILSLSDCVLIRIFSHLVSPSVHRETLLYPPSAPVLSNNPDFSAASLGQACQRFHTLYHDYVRLFNAQNSCACGAQPSLAAFPFAQSAVLDERFDTLPSCNDLQSLARLRVLSVLSFPSEAYGEALAAAVPNLREFSFGCFSWLARNEIYSSRHVNSYPIVQNRMHGKEQRGLRTFILRLPSSLRRLSLIGKYDTALLTCFWDSVSRLEQLEDLNVIVIKIHGDRVDNDAKFAMLDAVQNCNRLRRLSIMCPGAFCGEFFSRLPVRLSYISISSLVKVIYDLLYAGMPPLNDEDMVPGLQTLQLNGGSACLRNWDLLRPVASHLRKLYVHQIVESFKVDRDYVMASMPLFPKLEELHLLGENSDLRWGLNEDVLWLLLARAGMLRDLKIRIGRSHWSLTGKGLARALNAAASTLTLKRLKLDLVARFKMPEQFESAASVIGLRFGRLEELDLVNTLLTPACLASIGEGCSFLTSLKLGVEVRRRSGIIYEDGEEEAAKVEHLAAAIGSHFPQLEDLVLSGTNISSEGLTVIGSGCLILKNLSLARCSEVDDGVVMVLRNFFSVLGNLDLCETSVSERGLKSLGQLRQQSPERSPLHIRASSPSVSEAVGAQLEDQFPGLKFTFDS